MPYKYTQEELKDIAFEISESKSIVDVARKYRFNPNSWVNMVSKIEDDDIYNMANNNLKNKLPNDNEIVEFFEKYMDSKNETLENFQKQEDVSGYKVMLMRNRLRNINKELSDAVDEKTRHNRGTRTQTLVNVENVETMNVYEAPQSDKDLEIEVWKEKCRAIENEYKFYEEVIEEKLNKLQSQYDYALKTIAEQTAEIERLKTKRIKQVTAVIKRK